MTMFHPVDLGELLDFSLRIVLAFVLATAIGAERQFRQRSAGLRTNVLVAVGSQIAAYVVSGIGFLGAGVIMKEGSHVWGLNTAATLWCSAAVGALCGVNLAAEAGVLTIAVLAGNTLLRPLVNQINRAPMDERSAEATYEVHVLTRAEHVGEVRDLLDEQLARANYPIREIEVSEHSDDVTELAATLVSTTVKKAEMEAVTAALGASPLVSHATWSSSAID
jgi:putative Mg2+ transporter-C (MgtC) family protein